MVIFPNCKINLGLRITRKRTDGYHDLETVFYPVGIRDVLEVISAGNDSGNPFEFTQSGLAVDGSADSNLCSKAYHLLKSEFPSLPSLKLHLHKHIPMGAGLGGGSADGAFTLRLLNEKFNLDLTTEQLIDRALTLGSDCPFFILNKPCSATGRGEFLQPVTLDLSAYRFVVVSPGVHVSTAWAFSQITPAASNTSLTDIVQLPLSSWKDKLANDFEGPVFAKYPLLKQVKEELYNKGALYASLTGSGSSLYGIFPKDAVPMSWSWKDYRVDVV
jgi:4-diphosphocytidyl-2-C-methyl-D-erythritol kinase